MAYYDPDMLKRFIDWSNGHYMTNLFETELDKYLRAYKLNLCKGWKITCGKS